MKLAANLSTLFTERPFLERFDAAARAGFAAVECQFPYGEAPADILHALRDSKQTLVLHNLPAGDWASGERGIACHPDRVPEFDAGVDLAVEYATTLGCRQLNCLAGRLPEEVDAADARATFIRNLGHAARRLQKAELTLLIEALNTHDVPGFFLTGTGQAVDILKACGPANPFVQFDAYHMHRMGEDLVATLRRHASHIRHIQIADDPGRHEPGTGSIDFSAFFATLEQCGYAGVIGCEYNPTDSTEDGLGWAAPFLRG